MGVQLKNNSWATSVNWASFCREVCYDAMMNNPQKMGGVGMTVDIDESKMGIGVRRGQKN